LLVRTDLSIVCIEIPTEHNNIELICADITVCGTTFRTIVYYRPPHYLADDVTYLSKSIELLSKLIECKHNIILMGDFNLPNIDSFKQCIL
jgi:hypothetical protein